jgi:hypothetical protein
VFNLPNITNIEQLFSSMEPEHLSGEAFTPSLHTENIQLGEDSTELETEEEVVGVNPSRLGEFIELIGSEIPVPMAAVDVGVMDLGMTRTGFALAFKGAAIFQSIDGILTVIKVGPRVKFITPDNRAQILRFIGRELMDEDIFVDTNPDGTLTIKSGAREPNQFKDRIRNYIERMLQLDILRHLQNGILLIDGTLTLRTYNTPEVFMEYLGREAQRRNSDIVGVSKKSKVTVGGIHISALLDDDPPNPGFKRVFVEDSEGSDSAAGARNLGALFAVRFAPGGFTFRVDAAHRSIIQTEEEILQTLYANTQMTLGYPNLLRLAHIHSAFTKAEIVSLQVQIAHDYNVHLRQPEDLSVVFAPFRKGFGG